MINSIEDANKCLDDRMDYRRAAEVIQDDLADNGLMVSQGLILRIIKTFTTYVVGYEDARIDYEREAIAHEFMNLNG